MNIIYISMMVWVVLMRLLCSGTLRFHTLPNGARSYKVPVAVAILTMSYIVFWIGMRTGIADTAAYIHGFKSAPTGLGNACDTLLSDQKGQAWQALVIVFKTLITADVQCWLMALSMFMGFAVALCYQRYSEAFFFSTLLFLLNGNFTWMFNGMRQFLCVTALMLGFRWLVQGKTIKYMALICCLGWVHVTVLLMIPIYFVVRQKPWSKLVLLSIFVTAIAVIFAEPFAGAIEHTVTTHSASYKDSTVMLEDDDGVHPLRVAIAAAPVILAWIKRRDIQGENNAVLKICINMCLLAALLYAFGVVTSGILMGRLPIYCEVYASIALPMLINRFKTPLIRASLLAACIAGYAVFYFLIIGNVYYISDITGLVK